MESGNQRVTLQISGKKTISTQVKYLHPSRHTEVIIGRLRLGKCYLNAYLQQIGKHQDGLCNHCNKPETVSHFLTECRPSHSPTCLAVLAPCKTLNLAATLDISHGRENEKSLLCLAMISLLWYSFGKIIKIVAARCHDSKLKCTKFDFGRGSAPDPTRGPTALPRTH